MFVFLQTPQPSDNVSRWAYPRSTYEVAIPSSPSSPTHSTSSRCQLHSPGCAEPCSHAQSSSLPTDSVAQQPVSDVTRQGFDFVPVQPGQQRSATFHASPDTINDQASSEERIILDSMPSHVSMDLWYSIFILVHVNCFVLGLKAGLPCGVNNWFVCKRFDWPFLYLSVKYSLPKWGRLTQDIFNPGKLLWKKTEKWRDWISGKHYSLCAFLLSRMKL